MQQIGEAAEDLLLERIRKGSASPTELVAAARLNSPLEIANLERIKAQTQYLEAQRKKAESETFQEELMQRAVEAMGRYRGDNR